MAVTVFVRGPCRSSGVLTALIVIFLAGARAQTGLVLEEDTAQVLLGSSRNVGLSRVNVDGGDAKLGVVGAGGLSAAHVEADSAKVGVLEAAAVDGTMSVTNLQIADASTLCSAIGSAAAAGGSGCANECVRPMGTISLDRGNTASWDGDHFSYLQSGTASSEPGQSSPFAARTTFLKAQQAGIYRATLSGIKILDSSPDDGFVYVRLGIVTNADVQTSNRYGHGCFVFKGMDPGRALTCHFQVPAITTSHQYGFMIYRKNLAEILPAGLLEVEYLGPSATASA